MNSTPEISESSEPPGWKNALNQAWSKPETVKARAILMAIGYRIFRLGGELTAIVLGLGIAIGWLVASAMARQSTDMTVLRPNLQMWFADAFDGREAEFGRLDVAWMPADDRFVVTLEDAVIRDRDGLILESFELVRTTIAASPRDFRKPRVVNATVQGGVISYVETEAGDITIGLGPPETVGRVGPVYRSAEPASEDEGKFRLEGLESVQVLDAKLYIQNAVSGIEMLADVEKLDSAFSDDGGLVLTATGRIDQESTPARFNISTVADPEFARVRAKLDLTNARPDEIAPTQGRFRGLRDLAAAVNLSSDVDFSRIYGLQAASFDLNVGQGHLDIRRAEEARRLNFNSLETVAALDPGQERMRISKLDLNAPKLAFQSTGFLSQLGNLSDGDVNSSPVFDLQFKELKLDATPKLPAPLTLSALRVEGQADVDSRSLTIRSGELGLFNSKHTFSGEMALSDDNRPNRLRLTNQMSGTLTPDQFLALWPVEAIGGARRWIDRAILSGALTDMKANIDLDPAFFETQELTSDRIQVRFGLTDADVKYMEFMPPAQGVSARGGINGNQLSLTYQGGRVEDVIIESGTVEIPRLLPKGGDIIITAQGQGSAPTMLSIMDNEPFNFASRYGVDTSALAGQGSVSMRVVRPLLEFFPREEIEYQVDGRFTDVKAPFSFGRHEIRNGTVTLDANRDRMVMSGPVDIGPWQANMQWQETFGDDPPPTQYSASGPVTADVLDGLGIGSRGWFAGTAELDIQAIGRGMNVSSADFDVDLTNTSLSAERVWMKPEGETARLTGTLTRDPEVGYAMREAKLTGAGVDVMGEVLLQPDYKLDSLDLTQVRIDGFMDAAVQLVPDRDRKKLSAKIDGRFFDVSPWTQDVFARRENNLDVPFDITGQVETLVLDPIYTLTDAQLDFSHTGEVVERAKLLGKSESGDFTLDMSTLEDATRTVTLRVPDASNAIEAFLGLSNTSEGELRLTASLPPAGEDGPLQGQAQLRNFRLDEAPAMAQLLSLASLTGLADTLSGGGMQFDRFTVPFTMLGDDIAIRDARLYGPALGMTGDGDINLGLRVLDFDGTIVPSYTANSILGDIPVLGDIFVQEKDGGLFALTYTVSGPFEKTQIAVNPLSALTPGFLRRIFKPDREDVDDMLREKIEDVAPKDEAELEPELEPVPTP